MRLVVTVVLATAALLAGCSDGASPTSAPSPTGTTSRSDPLGEGRSAPEVVRSFTCRADSDGRWSAGGRLENTSETARTYGVAALVGPADGKTVTARQLTVTVGPRTTESFTLPRLPASTPDGPCHLRVVVID